MPKNTLGKTLEYRLVDWIKGNWERIDQVKPSRRVVAEWANKGLDATTITENHIASVTSGLGFKWPVTRSTRHHPLYRDRLRALASIVGHLYDELGMARPERLRDMITPIPDKDPVEYDTEV